MPRIGTISANIIQSEIRTMSIECAKVGGINLSQGFSDTDIQPVIAAEAKRAIDAGINHYTRYDGVPELKRAVADKLRRYNGIDYDAESEVTITSGSTAGLFCVLYGLFQPGDEIVVFEPYYGYHVNSLHAAQMTPVYVRLDAPEWTLDTDRLERAITDRTRAIILNTPTNPTGKVWTVEEIRRVGIIAEKHDLFIITDEIYEYFLYDGLVHVSPASIPELKERTITLGGYSKTFSITGWRIGYVGCSDEYSRIIGYVHDLYYVCAPAPLQMGTAAGINELDESFYTALRESYARKRNMTCDALERAGLSPVRPAGAYYVMADISRVPGASSKDRAMKLLEMTGIACVPGSAFYHDDAGERFGRFCFAKRDEVLQKAIEKFTLLSL